MFVDINATFLLFQLQLVTVGGIFKCLAANFKRSLQFSRRAPVLSAAVPYSFRGRLGKEKNEAFFA